MKCLSIKQPWAHMILHCGKDVENRTWRTDYRGPLLIHASKTFDGRPDDWVDADNLKLDFDAIKVLPTGAIVGVVDVVDCKPYDAYDFMRHPSTRSRWHNRGCYGLYLRNPRSFNVVSVWRGKLGLFDVPDDVVADVLKMEATV